MMYHLRNLLCCAPVVLLVLLFAPGCLSTQGISPVADSLDSLGTSMRGIRESNIRLAYREGLTVEQAADSIIALASDRTTKVSAYLWKIYCIPVIRQIYAQSDPLASTVDALAFSLQCEDYFTTGLGKDRFGPYQQIAINASNVNRHRLMEINRQRLTSANFDSLVARSSRWTKAHPLSNNVFERPSIVAEMDVILARQDYSIGSAVGRIADDVDDLSGRLSLLSAQLPREARWQGEYIVTDLALKERLTKLDTAITVLTTTLTGIEEELKTGEILVDIASLRSLHSDLQAALHLVSAERAIVLTEVERLRLSTLGAAELAVNRSVETGLEKVEAIVDRVLWKTAVILIAAFGGTALLILLARGQRRRKMPATESN